MVILIGAWESVLVLLIVVALTALVVWWSWRRRLPVLLQTHAWQQQAEIRDMIREFEHQASHCIGPIKGNLYLLNKRLQTENDEESVADALREVQKYEWRLTRLVENITFVTRLEAPGQSLRFSEAKLDVIVSDIVDDFQDVAKEKGITLTWRAAPEQFPRITANDDSLRQVFINLIHNAIKYCDKGDEIDVALEANKTRQMIYARVSDTGPGIPREDWVSIFEKGYTVEGARGREPKEGGQGLGLYIAKLVVEKHGGSIGVTSELDKGTTFTITLPIQRL